MRHTIRLVNSINNLDPRFFAGQILITPDGQVYTPAEGDELGGIGSFFKKIAQVALPLAGAIAAPFTGGLSAAAAATLTGALTAAGSVAGGLINVFGSGSGGSGQQAKGLAAIQAKGAEVIKAFDLLKQKISSEPNFSKADAYTAADKLVALLSDPAEFYQAKNGNDAAALAGFKTQAQQLAPQVKALADAADAAKLQTAAQTGTTTGTATGQTITRTVDAQGNIIQTVSSPASAGMPFGLSTTELVLLGLGGYLIFFRS